MNIKIERYHWRHYFGGVAVVLLVLQLCSGVFLTMFYQADLAQAYASVQSLYQDFSIGARIRDSHRWIAFFVFSAVIVHVVRSLLRKEFLNRLRKISWLTGGLLILPVLALMVTGFILPWEWRAYWFMEMVPNYLGVIPLVGPYLKDFLIEAFSLNRNLIAHVVILPVVAYILIDIHILAMMRKRKTPILRYLGKHTLLSIPFIAAVAVLAVYIPMPTEDPNIIPMPLEGTNIPMAEWFVLFLMWPFLNFEGGMATFLVIGLPLIILLVLMFLPYAFKGRDVVAQASGFAVMPKKLTLIGVAASVLITVFVAAGPFGLLYATSHESPTLGCNSCHNVSMGIRMGVPPKAFKDRNVVPLVADNRWMVEHWFYPQVAW